MQAIPPDVWEGIRTAAEITTDVIFRRIRELSRKIVPKPPPRPEPKYIARHDREGRDLIERVNVLLKERRMLTLTGAGGVGKTTIAIEVANRLFEKRIGGFKEGIIWVSADGRPDFGLLSLVDNVLDQLVPVDQVEAIRRLPLDAKQELARRLLGNRKRCLLALDNFETIPEEEHRLIIAYLAELPCARLITSRKPLPKGEEIAVDQMTPKEARAFLKMRVERPEKPDRLKVLDLDQVADTAGYNPMLMRWVVAQLEQAMRPQDVFDEIARGRGEAVDRIFGRSFRLLGEDGQTALLALALFAPTASREALAAVCGFEDSKDRVNEAIKKLSAFDLLEVADDWLCLIALTRILAKAQLITNGRASGLHSRFISYFLAYAYRHKKPTPENYSALEQELSNILATLSYCTNMGRSEDVLYFWDALNEFLWDRRHWSWCILLAKQALEASEDVKSSPIRGGILSVVGWIYVERGEYEQAAKLIAEAKAIFENANDYKGVSRMLRYTAIMAYRQGSFEDCWQLLQSALSIAETYGYKDSIALIKNVLGCCLVEKGDFTSAHQQFEDARALFVELGIEKWLSGVLLNMANMEIDQGQIDCAEDYLTQAQNIAKTYGQREVEAGIKLKRAKLERRKGNPRMAHRLAKEAKEVFEELEMLDSIHKADKIIKALVADLDPPCRG